MEIPFSKQTLRQRLGFTTDAELARYFGISTSAVAQWSEEQPVPKLRWLEALTRSPELVTRSADGGDCAPAEAA